MSDLHIDLKPQHLFIATVSLFAGYLAWFLLNMSAFHYISLPVQHNMHFNIFDGVLFAINSLSYQNYLVGYMVCIYTIYFRLFHIRKYIEHSEPIKNNLEQDLKGVASLVDKICDSLDCLKVCYTINTVIYLSHFAFYSIIATYGFISYFSKTNRSSLELTLSLMTLCWHSYYAPFVIWMFLLASWIKKEGKMIEVFIQKLLHKTPSQKVKTHKRAEFIFMQLHHRRPLISCGVFVIDWHLLFYFMGICFSYLVIVIQFDNQIN